MANTQQVATNRSEGAKKAAATRAANKANAKREDPMPTGKTVGPKGAPLEQNTSAPEVTLEQRKGERRQQQENLAAQFAPTEQTAPAVHEPTPEELAKQKLLEGVRALAESLGLDPASVLAQPGAQPAPQRAERQTKNNITRPAKGTTTGQIWDIADEISASKNGQGFASIAELRERAELKQTNENTLKTQYARWRSFNGLKGRQDAVPPAPAAPEQPLRRATDPQPEPAAQ